MHFDARRGSVAEAVCLGVFFVWLIWLPMPFGSVIEIARLPLIAVPMLLATAAALLRLRALRRRTSDPRLPRPWSIWSAGAAAFFAVCCLQLVPLPPSLLRAVSPESLTIWTMASRVAELAGVAISTSHPISVRPSATLWELFRIAALFATFQASALLIRNHARRMVLAATLSIAALFQILYGVRAAGLGTYEVWGWKNTLIHGRVTGTFVNPNHFAHYVAIVVPLALFLAAVAWHETTRTLPLARRIAQLFERRFMLFGFAMVTAVGAVAAILVAQSRGGLLALFTGLAIAGALAPGQRRVKLALAGVACVLVVVTLVALLGTERTIARFKPSAEEEATLVGRLTGIRAATGIWRRFPVLGSGLGTFGDVVSMTQTTDVSKVYHHVHNDYLEVAATSGTLGFAIGLMALAAGAISLVRMTWRRDNDLTWRRRAFQAAAFASLAIVLVHALIDFNFFIPSNPATLAAILGAAVASHDHDRRTRDRQRLTRSASGDLPDSSSAD